MVLLHSPAARNARDDAGWSVGAGVFRGNAGCRALGTAAAGRDQRLGGGAQSLPPSLDARQYSRARKAVLAGDLMRRTATFVITDEQLAVRRVERRHRLPHDF